MIKIVSEEISKESVLGAMASPDCGALVFFEGIVRRESEGKQVTHLFYEAYAPMAEKEIEKICQSALSRWPVARISVIHRIGRLEIGDTAVLIAVASGHRSEAFDACRFVIDEIKKTVPIWKKEHFSDGEVWVEEGGG
jgi:molybdopterin synthase catalytic subunit